MRTDENNSDREKTKWKWMLKGKKRFWQMIMRKNPVDCHEHKIWIGRLIGVHFSSIVNAVIRTISNFFTKRF